MSQITAFVQARLRAVVIAAVLILAVYGLIGYRRASQRAVEAALAQGTPAARDAAVRGLVRSGRLADVLISTENPDQDVTSPRNQRSLLIRRNATDSVNRLSAAGRITPAQTFGTLFPICKDADLTVKAAAEGGLAALGRQSDAGLDAVVRRLSDGDPDIRNAAVDVLGLIGGDKTAAAVNAVLPSAAAQDAAILALQRIGPPAAPLVVAHLQDPATQTDIPFRQQMAGLLDLIAAPSAAPELTRLAADPAQPSVQRIAQVALADTVLAAYTAVGAARDAVTAAKDAPGRAAAQAAVRKAAAALPAVGIAEPLLRQILRDGNADSLSRAEAALALGRLADPASLAALVPALGDLDTQVRDAAQTGLQFSGPAAVPPLTAALSAGQTVARAGAAQALGGIGTPAAVAALAAAVADPAAPAAVRQGAAVGLGRSGSAAAVPPLVLALGDPSGAVAGAAQDSLLAPALEKPAIPALVAALGRATPVPFYASQTLGRMGALAQSAAVPLLTRTARTGAAPAQTWAAVTLGEVGTGDAPALAALQSLARSVDPHVQYAASQSLLKLKGA